MSTQHGCPPDRPMHSGGLMAAAVVVGTSVYIDGTDTDAVPHPRGSGWPFGTTGRPGTPISPGRNVVLAR